MLRGGLNLPFNLLIMYRCSLSCHRSHWQRDLLVIWWQAMRLFVWAAAQQGRGTSQSALCGSGGQVFDPYQIHMLTPHSEKQFFTRRRKQRKHLLRLSQQCEFSFLLMQTKSREKKWQEMSSKSGWKGVMTVMCILTCTQKFWKDLFRNKWLLGCPSRFCRKACFPWHLQDDYTHTVCHAFVLFSPSSSGVTIYCLRGATYGEKVLQTNKRPQPRF